MGVTQLANGKTLRRRIGDLIVEIDRRGVTLRKYRCRRRRRFSWEQVAALEPEAKQRTVTGEQERRDGRKRLGELDIVLGDQSEELDTGGSDEVP